MSSDLFDYGVECGYGDAFLKLAGPYDYRKKDVAPPSKAALRTNRLDKLFSGPKGAKMRALQAKMEEKRRQTIAKDPARHSGSMRDAKDPRSLGRRFSYGVGNKARALGDHIKANKGAYALGTAAAGLGGYALYKHLKDKKEEKGVEKAAAFIYDYING